MSGGTIAAGAGQILGGWVLAPLVPGTIQSLKARLQGRRGASPLQPFRELRRLWGKSRIDPQPSGIVFRSAPVVVAAALATAVLAVPIAGITPGWGIGDDVLVVVGLFALARFALAAGTWDTGMGFGLMGASRELTLSVFGEALVLLVVVAAAIPGGSTDLAAMMAAADGPAIWNAPLHWCAAAAFLLVILVETGRQPIDNPDTHLELTMIHEGPLLEYAGPDLALLQWAAAVRHWLLLLLGTQLFLPHSGGVVEELAALTVFMVALVVVLAVVESTIAKARLLVVPSYLAAGGAVVLVGIASWFLGGRP